METTQFSLTMGVNPGFKHRNEARGEAVGPRWQAAAADEFARSQIYVSATVTPAKTVYHTDWDCPLGGENVATVTGVRNPAFVADDAAWRDAVRRVAARVGRELGQKNVYVTFQAVEFECLNP